MSQAILIRIPCFGFAAFEIHLAAICFGFRASNFGFSPIGGIVTKIFWVTCPQCKGEFYCHWQELRHKKIKLLCPYCSHQFLDEESPKIVE